MGFRMSERKVNQSSALFLILATHNSHSREQSNLRLNRLMGYPLDLFSVQEARAPAFSCPVRRLGTDDEPNEPVHAVPNVAAREASDVRRRGWHDLLVDVGAQPVPSDC